MQAHAKDSFAGLSFAQQRLLLVARAMVKHPPLLILDEPSSGLDEENFQRLALLIQAMHQAKNSAIIYVSHREETEIQAKQKLVLTPSEAGSTAQCYVL